MEKKHKKKFHPLWALFNTALAATAVLFWDTPMSVCGGLIMMFTFDKMIYYVSDDNVEHKVSKSFLKKIVKEEAEKFIDKAKTEDMEEDSSSINKEIPYMVTSNWMANSYNKFFDDYMPFYKSKFNFTEREEELIKELSHIYGMKIDNVGFPVTAHDIYFEPQRWMVSDYDYYRFKNDRLTLREIMFFIDKAMLNSFDKEVVNYIPGYNEDCEVRFGTRGLMFTREHWKLFKKLLGQEKEIPKSKRELIREVEFQSMLKKQDISFLFNTDI